MKELLRIEELSVAFPGQQQEAKALDSVSFTVGEGEIVGLVGESGCGKSLTALTVMGLLPEKARATGSVRLEGRELLTLSETELCDVRGSQVSMIFQEPMTALNPLMRVGDQIAEAYRSHHNASASEARQATLEMMRSVGLSRVEALYDEYPHRLSGGMKQRIVVAMALINRPALLIADEPTTALDVTIQLQILDLLRELQAKFSTSVLLITHNLGIVHKMCSRVIVMYAGYIVEEGATSEVLSKPLHPYTRRLLAAIPTVERQGKALYSIPGIVAPLEERQTGVCPFSQRCDRAFAPCFRGVPPLREVGDRKLRCLLPGGETDELSIIA